MCLLITYSIEIFYFLIYHEDFYGLLTMYYMSWGLGYFYENSQLEIRQCNKIYAMRASDGRFITNRKRVFKLPIP